MKKPLSRPKIKEMEHPVVVSRCDRLGDLVLSLPVLGFLRDAGFKKRILHCSPYARAVAEWAQYNELCEEIWVAGEAPPSIVDARCFALSLQHSKLLARDYRRFSFLKSYGPRSKLSCLWTYKRSLAQKRSRVEKSEMEYNIDLARFMLEDLGKAVPDFTGLPALEVPSNWVSPRRSPHTVVVVGNSGSALNWKIEDYVAYAERVFETSGRSLDFLVSGNEASFRKEGLLSQGVQEKGMGIVESFGSIQELIAYLAGAKFVVSSSTGPLHIAHAAGVDVFGVYPTKRVESFERWRPHGYWHKGALRYQLIAPEE